MFQRQRVRARGVGACRRWPRRPGTGRSHAAVVGGVGGDRDRRRRPCAFAAGAVTDTVGGVGRSGTIARALAASRARVARRVGRDHLVVVGAGRPGRRPCRSSPARDRGDPVAADGVKPAVVERCTRYSVTPTLSRRGGPVELDAVGLDGGGQAARARSGPRVSRRRCSILTIGRRTARRWSSIEEHHVPAGRRHVGVGGPVDAHASPDCGLHVECMKRWSMSKLCVTEPMRTSDTELDAGRVGRADREGLAVVDGRRARSVIVGRAPLNRYGGE